MNKEFRVQAQNQFVSSVPGLPVLAHSGVFLFSVFVAGCGTGPDKVEHTIIPLPASVEWMPSDTFHFTEETRILFDSTDTEAERVGAFLSGLIGNSTETMPAVEARCLALVTENNQTQGWKKEGRRTKAQLYQELDGLLEHTAIERRRSVIKSV